MQTERGDPEGWRSFLAYLRDNDDVAHTFRHILVKLGLATNSIVDDSLLFQICDTYDLTIEKAIEFKAILDPEPFLDVPNQPPLFRNSQPTKIMFIEQKPGLAGHARIGRVATSASRRTIYYSGRKLQSLNGKGYKANYFNVESGLEYWLSNCKRNGNDTLYPGVVAIDEDAREEYWTSIRKLPGRINEKRFRSEGKYSKRRPK